MNIAIIALTPGGAKTALHLARDLPGQQMGRGEARQSHRVSGADVFLPVSLGTVPDGATKYACSTGEMIRELFGRYQGLIMIMAAGIAVRGIAPLLRGKDQDPGVVVIDEAGKFAVSLLSGHLGGANDLAEAAARALGGTPVITTSTDVQGRLAVDNLARDLGARIEPLGRIVDINGALAKGEQVWLLSEAPLPLGQNHPVWNDPAWRIKITGEVFEEAARISAQGGRVALLTPTIGTREFLYLRPPVIVAGVGCRKGKGAAEIHGALLEALQKAGLSPLSIKKLVSIEAKEEEPGILKAAARLGVEAEFFAADVLRQVMSRYQDLAQSEFVNLQMGVGGVCEPASLAGCRQGKLILGKQAKHGVTVALAQEEYGW